MPPQIYITFFQFSKIAGETCWGEVTRQQRGSEPDPQMVCKWFAAQKHMQGDKRLRQNSSKWCYVIRKTGQILFICLLSSKNKTNVPIINIDGEHTKKIEDGVCSLKLSPCNHEVNFAANFVVILIDANVSNFFYLQSFHVPKIKLFRFNWMVRWKYFFQ